MQVFKWSGNLFGREIVAVGQVKVYCYPIEFM
jgi:hypothetical protein